mgnify:FL=1|tara:strand:- start:632 stop:1141 length:510 start_codon:yes stop_codon:yes gene_type:complete
MTYAKVIDGAIESYPYSFGNLRKDNSNVSFPKDFFERENELANFNVVKIVATDKPSKRGWVSVEESPSLSGGVWSQNWKLVPKDASDVTIAEVEETTKPVQDGYTAEESTPELVGDVWKQKWNLVENTWLESRIAAYGNVDKQIEFITENGLEAWQTKVAEIKARYPKT